MCTHLTKSVAWIFLQSRRDDSLISRQWADVRIQYHYIISMLFFEDILTLDTSIYRFYYRGRRDQFIKLFGENTGHLENNIIRNIFL